MKKISVIIRNRNEERWIGYAIQSVLDSFLNPEIIILDDHSTDDSLRIVREFCFEDIKINTVDDYTPGKALNQGVNLATNNIILILSSHAQIQNKTISMDDIELKLQENVAIFGNQIPIYKGKKIHKRYIWSHFGELDIQDMWSALEERYFLHNAFAFYKKEILKMYPFDETLAGKEDRYWANDMIINQHGHIWYDTNLKIIHHWTPNGNTWKGVT